MTRVAVVLGLLVCLEACASTPNVVYSYYPAGSTSTVTVTQTIDCTSDKKAMVVLNSPAVNTLYFADHSKNPYTLQIKSLDGAFADADVALGLYDDGRLKSVNAATTGQGESILKAAVSLAVAIAPLGGGTQQPTVAAAALPECTFISNWGNGKPVTVTYSHAVDLGGITAPALIAVNPTPGSAELYAALKAQLPVIQIQVSKPTVLTAGARPIGSVDAGAVSLTLQETSSAKVVVLAQGQAIFSGNIIVPLASTYTLPIPKAALFGKQSFAVAISEAGAVTSVEYGKQTGASGPLNVLTAAATAAAPTSTATQAADVKAQADLIAQQQRLARCQAQPDKCQ
jgi:hypothetical protein